MCRRLLPCLGACLLLILPANEARADSTADELVLTQAGLTTDGAGLLEFLRRRTADGADETRLKTLIRQLGDDSFHAREQASRLLVAVGARARQFLRDATHDPDIEIVR